MRFIHENYHCLGGLGFITAILSAMFFFGKADFCQAQAVQNFLQSQSFLDLAYRIANYIFLVVVPIAVIAIIWSGILFLSAGDSEERITKAKRAITYSIIGLAIALVGSGFVTLIKDITGSNVSTAQAVIDAFGRLANAMYYVGPALVVIFLIWIGITYMMAGGDERKIGAAKKQLFWAIVGAAIIIGTGAIIRTLIYYLR
ncbi:MAG: hypothetical protein HY813_00350 [Candidatus Portnoybacteria bacterium]|nr:hypothetical protein [Candidatus Portnoybacteria bacterium]